MELDHLTQEIGTPKGSAKTSLEKAYASILKQIITKANIGRRQLDPNKETPIFVAIWFEALYGVIPENRLNDCYLWAIRNRGNNFPMQPSEMAQAWTEIKQSEMYKRAPENRQLTHGFCNLCYNTGSQPVRNERGVIIAMKPCKH